ncbi:Lar family restriction alleviation protein [Tianweitania sediminis]|uniref:Lar family restriction alleviation protein n=1 Tax=Tianweitania sediminis TaxID=1502156 RepID=A0A8J7QYS2_9HYPH|nr:Lar family restriction alleviation protein [Tianweitania sediminis]MBP0438455.1 Lar family restriction alleviation protein [Tianweitania sediminis]
MSRLVQSEPIGEVVELAGSLNDMQIVRWASGYCPPVGTKLFAHPQLGERSAASEPEQDAGLRPCPFCGASGDDLMVFCDPDEGSNNSGSSRRIQCAGCNIEAPFYASKAEAVSAWNSRSRQLAPDADARREAAPE